jgi:hypothetical protein
MFRFTLIQAFNFPKNSLEINAKEEYALTEFNRSLNGPLD